jgi:hypothetical protein
MMRNITQRKAICDETLTCSQSCLDFPQPEVSISCRTRIREETMIVDHLDQRRFDMSDTIMRQCTGMIRHAQD